MGGLGRFLVYLLVAAAVVAADYLLYPVLASLTAQLGAQWQLFGKPLAVGRYLADAVALTLPMVGALAAEYLSTGGRYSSLPRLLKLSDGSARKDLVLVLVQLVPLALPVLGNLMTFGFVALATRWLRAHVPPDLHLFDVSVAHLGWVATALMFYASVSLIDYLTHRLFHLPTFWPLHRLHHSATTLTPATAVRVHPADQVLTPLANTLPMLLWAPPEMFLLLFFAFYSYHEMFVHTSADIDWGWIGRHLYAPPVSHKLHHSAAQEHIDRNFSTNLLIWDQLFGTASYASRIERVGIAGERPQGLLRELLGDLRDLGRNLLGRVARLRA